MYAVLKEISDRHFEMMHPNKPKAEQQHNSSSASSSSSSSSSVAHFHRTSQPMLTPSATPPPSHVYINALSPRAPWASSSSHASLTGLCTQDARPLHAIDTTVTFSSPSQLPCQSVFQVFKNGLVVHQECSSVSVSSTPLSGPSHAAPMFVYSTKLVPRYWPYLSEVEVEGEARLPYR